MKIKSQPIEIDTNDIFKNDKLNRKKEIENLSELLVSLDSPFVLSLNSPWGTGKTTFTRLWVSYLKNNHQAVVYFNAWETDFSDDPLLSFLGEIDQDFKQLCGSSAESTAAWEKAKDIGGKIVRRSVPALIKIGTAGMLDASDLVEAQASEVIAGLSEDSIEAYLSQKSAIKDFKQSVETALARADGAGPIVIFVDELDRCNPNYAIRLLERIKHLFEVKGVVFVLSVDLWQLSHSVNSVYGQNFDAHGYLKRFIDVEYSLAQPNRKEFIKNLYAIYGMESFFTKRSEQPTLRYEVEHLCDTFEVLSRWEKMSLRETEQIFGRMHLVLRATPQQSYLFPALTMFLVVMRIKHPERYEEYVATPAGLNSAITYLHSLAPADERAQSFNAALIEGLLIAGKHQNLDHDDEVIKDYIDLVTDGKASADEIKYAKTVVDAAMKPTGSRFNQVDLDSLSSRVEMFSKFDFSDDSSEALS